MKTKFNSNLQMFIELKKYICFNFLGESYHDYISNINNWRLQKGFSGYYGITTDRIRLRYTHEIEQFDKSIFLIQDIPYLVHTLKIGLVINNIIEYYYTFKFEKI